MSKRAAWGGLIGAAALTVAALAAPTAVAQAPNPQVVVVDTDVACGTVTITLTNNDVGGYGFTWTTGPFDGGPAGESGRIDVAAGSSVTRTVRLPEDSFSGRGFLTLAVAYGPNTHRQPVVDLGLVVTDCEAAPPATTAPTTPPETTEPPVVPGPSSEPTSPPTSGPLGADAADGDFDQVGGRAPVGGIATGA